MAADPRAAAILNKFINKPEPIDEPAEAATKAAAGFLKLSLALNSLQRIGAAVSQSADPIAIEKDNNTLLKRIANNTKDIARNSE